MKRKTTFSIFVALILAVGCSQFGIGNANLWRKGMSPTEVEDLAGVSPKKTFVVSIPSNPNAKYTIEAFDIKYGDVVATYIAAFENDKLLYWGHPYEFNRHPDTKLNEIGIQTVGQLGS